MHQTCNAETAQPRSSRTDASLKLQAQQFAELFGNSPDLAALLTPTGDILGCNRPVAENTRHSFTTFFAMESRADLQYAIQRVAESRHSARVEAAGARADGSRRWYLVTLAPVLDGQTTVALNATAVDMTERKREEERLRRSEALMVDTQGVAHMGTWEWDITQPTAVYSAELCRIYGLDPHTHVPSYEDYLTRVHPDDRQRVMEATNKVFHEHIPYSHDERVFRTDGSMRYLHTWAMPVLDENGKLARLVGVCQDITERKTAELALEAHVRELARSNAELEQYARVTSHDLQEPLRTIASYVQLLKRRYGNQMGADADEIIETVADGAHRMKRLIGDLLDYSRISAGPPKLEPVNLAETLAAVRASLARLIEESGATITHGTLPTVLAEPDAMVSLLQNLISNAIKFRGDNTPQVVIEAQPRGGMVEIAVIDNGVGIDPAHFDRIFIVFQRLQTAESGTGIGLAICKKIVERYGGRIWVESTPGAGAAFRFTLPRLPPAR